MQTKTLSNLELEFPALENKVGGSLKGGGQSDDDFMGTWWYQRLYGISWGGASVVDASGSYWGGAYFDANGNYADSPINVYGTPTWITDRYYVIDASNNNTYAHDPRDGGPSGDGGYQDPTHDLNSQRLPPDDGSVTQKPNWCVFKAMEVANQFHGGNKDYSTIMNEYMNTLDQNGKFSVISNGFSGTFEQLHQLFNSQFNTKSLGYGANIDSVQSALNREHVLIGYIETNGPNNGHAVVITGYYGDSLTYFDPQSGHYISSPSGNFQDVVEIIGNK